MTHKADNAAHIQDLLFSQSTNALVGDLPGSSPVMLTREEEAQSALSRGDHSELRRIVRREAATGNTSVRLRALDRIATSRELCAQGRVSDAISALRAAIHLDFTCLEAQSALAELEHAGHPRSASHWWNSLFSRKGA
jgi:hypothetical protein